MLQASLSGLYHAYEIAICPAQTERKSARSVRLRFTPQATISARVQAPSMRRHVCLAGCLSWSSTGMAVNFVATVQVRTPDQGSRNAHSREPGMSGRRTRPTMLHGSIQPTGQEYGSLLAGVWGWGETGFGCRTARKSRPACVQAMTCPTNRSNRQLLPGPSTCRWLPSMPGGRPMGTGKVDRDIGALQRQEHIPSSRSEPDTIIIFVPQYQFEKFSDFKNLIIYIFLWAICMAQPVFIWTL